jgi:hypothetical protein
MQQETNLKKTELADAAVVLKALTQDWNLVDYNPDHEFLVFVNESREQMDFYPKKSFVLLLEKEGLIRDVDQQSSSERIPDIHYQTDGNVWKEITTAGIIVFRHQVTPKGQKLLRDAPRWIGRQIRPLRAATNEVDITGKVMSLVTYDRAAIKKLVDAFDQKATDLIRAALFDEPGSPNLIVCGPKLWKTLEPRAKSLGLQPKGSLIREELVFNSSAPKQTTLPHQPITGANEARLFWKSLREQFNLNEPLTVRHATSAERSADTYSYKFDANFQIPGRDNDFPPPDLTGYEILFVAEMNESRFVVLVANELDETMKHSAPELKWIEIIS